MKYDLPYLPADGSHLALYLTHLTKISSSPSPVNAAACAVAWVHRKACLPNPVTHPLVSQVLGSARRLLARPTHRKQPLRLKHVKQLLSKFGGHRVELPDLQTLTLIVLGFVGFFRWNDLSNIRVENLHFHSLFASIILQQRKNDQFRNGQTVYVARSFGQTCPVSLLERFLMKANVVEGPLFRCVKATNGGFWLSLRPLSYGRARERVLAMLSSIGLDRGEYGLHSLRSGGASAAANRGVSDRLIKYHGGWRSDTARDAYIKDSLESRLSVSRLIGL